MNPTFKMFREMIRQEDGYAISLGEQSDPTPLVVVLFWFLVLRMRQAYCGYFGHRWEVESDIGPESGSESFECTRCGECKHVQYY